MLLLKVVCMWRDSCTRNSSQQILQLWQYERTWADGTAASEGTAGLHPRLAWVGHIELVGAKGADVGLDAASAQRHNVQRGEQRSRSGTTWRCRRPGLGVHPGSHAPATSTTRPCM